MTPSSNFDFCILLQTGINAGQRSDKSMTRHTETKKGGSGQIFELLYFENRKEFAADFFLCVHSTYRWTNSMNMSKIWGGHLTTFLKSGCFGMEWP